MARMALEQGHTQLGLQIPDMTADGGMADAELIGRPGEAAMPGCDLESPDRV
jgi:hypothetical protein